MNGKTPPPQKKQAATQSKTHQTRLSSSTTGLLLDCGTPADVSHVVLFNTASAPRDPARHTLHGDFASCHATVAPSAHSCQVQSSLHPVHSPAQSVEQNMGQRRGSRAPHLVSAIQRTNYIDTGPSADLESDRSHL